MEILRDRDTKREIDKEMKEIDKEMKRERDIETQMQINRKMKIDRHRDEDR